MLGLKIRCGSLHDRQHGGTPGLAPLVSMATLRVEGSGLLHQWRNAAGDEFFLLGDVTGLRHANGVLHPPSLVKLETERFENPHKIPSVEGRFLVVKKTTEGVCEIWTDQFGRVDVYWQIADGTIVLATGLDLLPVAEKGSQPDSVGISHALTVYGSRPAKKHTLYQDVHRLGVDQGLRLSNGRYELLNRPFKAAETGAFGERDLHRYADLFLEAIRARASDEGNVVYLSSGWDSTSILACLVHLFGKRKVRAVIGRMRYSDRSGVINQFEIDRANAMAEYFGVRLGIIELDYRSQAPAMLERVRGFFRAQQFANLTGFNHWLLAEGTAKTAAGNEAVFAGEISDGAHNLGFSQFVSIFHPASMSFREYSDKMASYLFGPTFLKLMLKGEHELDPVWQLFKHRNMGLKFDPLCGDSTGVIRQLLSSFFLSGGRLPLYSLDNSRLLTARGRDIFLTESCKAYLQDIVPQVNPSSLYSWYLHLYNSFHWQGATVATLEHTAEIHGLRCVLPFHDSGVIDFLSEMPESWGRGLDLNPTKYPLKWMLRKRIDYPNHLQVGPHSYTYDVNPSFTLLGEILHASSFKPVFHQALQTSQFIHWLDESVFDHSYINGITQRYLAGEELKGQEMNDMGVLAIHSAIGVY
jgi:hypothetical protein